MMTIWKALTVGWVWRSSAWRSCMWHSASSSLALCMKKLYASSAASCWSPWKRSSTLSSRVSAPNVARPTDSNSGPWWQRQWNTLSGQVLSQWVSCGLICFGPIWFWYGRREGEEWSQFSVLSYPCRVEGGWAPYRTNSASSHLRGEVGGGLTLNRANSAHSPFRGGVQEVVGQCTEKTQPPLIAVVEWKVVRRFRLVSFVWSSLVWFVQLRSRLVWL